MADLNENELLKRLQIISNIEPGASSTDRAMKKAKQAVLNSQGQSRPGPAFFTNWTAPKFAAAAAVLLLALLGAWFLAGQLKTAKDNNIVIDLDQQKVQENINRLKMIEAQRLKAISIDLANMETLFAANDITGLIAMLDSQHNEVKTAAANYLAQIGTEDAIDKLKNLAYNWQGDTDSNPFAIAAEQIEERLRRDSQKTPPQTDISEAASGDTELLVPQVKPADQAREEVKSVHIVVTYIRYDGTIDKAQTWIRLPDCIHKEFVPGGRVVIDNGKERLVLDKEAKTAQFSESHTSVEPLNKHYMIEQVYMFRDKDKVPEHVILEKLDDLTTNETLVYSIKLAYSIEGTAWVDPVSMLPTEIEVYHIGDPNTSDNIKSGTVTFDYKPISDDVFAMKVPKGYQESRKTAQTFSGHVVDLEGRPVANASVHVKSWGLPPSHKQLDGVTNEDGFFVIKMVPNRETMASPVVIWAEIEDNNDFIAWTLLRSQFDAEWHKLGGQIPGDPGNIMVSDGYKVTKTESGTSWNGWCTGASDIILVAEPAGKITGRVTEIQGKPISGAEIKVGFELVDKYGNSKYYSNRLWETKAVTDKDGFYTVGCLPKLWDKTPWHVKVNAEGYVNTNKKLKSKRPLEVLEVDFELFTQGVTVRGTLIDNYATPLADRSLYAMVDGKSYMSCSTKTDKDGRFELTNCPIVTGLQVKADLSHGQMTYDNNGNRQLCVYYPDVIVDVGFTEGRFDYEVQMTTLLPEIDIDVEVVDSAGQPIPHYPVEVRAASGSISSQWKSDMKLSKRTDENGFCRLRNVPDVEGLRLMLAGGLSIRDDRSRGEEYLKFTKELSRQYSNYKWTVVPIEIEPGETEYTVRAVILTKEEYNQRQKEKTPQ